MVAMGQLANQKMGKDSLPNSWTNWSLMECEQPFGILGPCTGYRNRKLTLNVTGLVGKSTLESHGKAPVLCAPLPILGWRNHGKLLGALQAAMGKFEGKAVRAVDKAGLDIPQDSNQDW